MGLTGIFYGKRAFFHHAKGELDRARPLYEKAIKQGDNNIEHIASYGALLLRDGEYEKSVEMFDLALKRKPGKVLHSLTRMNRAIAYMMLGELDKARTALEDLHLVYPSLRVYQTLGYFYVFVKEYDKAVEYGQSVLVYDEEDPILLDNLGQAYFELGDYENAQIYFERAITSTDGDERVDVQYHMGQLRRLQGRNEEALEHFIAAWKLPINKVNDCNRDELRSLIEQLGGQIPDEDEIQKDDRIQKVVSKKR